MTLGVCVCVCVSAELRLHARRGSLGGEGNALYPALCSYTIVITTVAVADAERGCTVPVSSSRGFTYVPSTSPGSPCGTPAQPWIVDAEPGQHLDVSVIDFAATEADGSDGSPSSQPPCPGYLLDQDSAGVGRRNVSLCHEGRQRQRDVYQSVSHVIELITYGDQAIAVKSPEQQPATFLVRFEGQYICIRCVDTICEVENKCCCPAVLLEY